jgi:hypothetical protein
MMKWQERVLIHMAMLERWRGRLSAHLGDINMNFRMK